MPNIDRLKKYLFVDMIANWRVCVRAPCRVCVRGKFKNPAMWMVFQVVQHDHNPNTVMVISDATLIYAFARGWLDTREACCRFYSSKG